MPYYFTNIGKWNDVGTAFIGVLSIITGLMVYFSYRFDFTDYSPMIFLTFFYFTLGIWSIFTNSIKNNYYDWRGLIDIIDAICLLLIYFGDVYSIFRILGAIIAIKGGLSFFLITAKGY